MVTISDKKKIIELYQYETVEEFMKSSLMMATLLRTQQDVADMDNQHRAMSYHEVRQILRCGDDTVKRLVAEKKLYVNADGKIPYKSLQEFTNAGK